MDGPPPEDGHGSSSVASERSSLFGFLRSSSSSSLLPGGGASGEPGGEAVLESPSRRTASAAELLSLVLESYLPRREAPPQHVDLRGEVAVVAEEEAPSLPDAEVEAGVMEKFLRGLKTTRPELAVGAFELLIRAVTGEQVCLRVGAGPVSETSSRIRSELQDKLGSVIRSRLSLTLDRVVLHAHLRPVDGGKHAAPADASSGVAEGVGPGSGGAAGTGGGGGGGGGEEEATVVDASSPTGGGGGGSGAVLLSRIPVALSSCRRMTQLTIEGQHLLSIEDVLGMESLEELRVVRCDLREVPSHLLQRLQRLRFLDLRENGLTSVSLSGGHERLASLCLSHNQITQMPSFVSRLPNLVELDVSVNKLSSLPSDMRNLTLLSRLNVEGNALTTPTVPLIREVLGSIDVVTRFPRLLHLNLARNKVTELPQYIENLTSLAELIVSDNRLTRLPAQLVAVPYLSVLDLSGNVLGAVAPREVMQIKGLTVLRLARTHMKQFPQNLAQLSQLKLLDVSHNKIRQISRVDVSGLLSVTSLDVASNRLETCEFAAELLALTRFNVSGNALRALPDDVNHLESLRFLDASRNRLTALPDSCGQLCNLEEVDLSHNALEALGAYWNASAFPRLRVLLLEGNPRAATALHPSFSTLTTLTTLSMLGVLVDAKNLYIQSPDRFDLPQLVQAAAAVRHPLLLAAFFGLFSRPEHRDGFLSSHAVELMLSLCSLGVDGGRPGVLHTQWPPKDVYQPDTVRYMALRTLSALTHRMDANGPRWTIYQHGAPAVLMDVINRHPDVRYKLLCIRLLGNLALHTTVKSQIFHSKSEVVAYLEGVARTSHSDSIKRFCNRTFAIFGICQHFQTSLLRASLGRHAGVRILCLDGGGTRSLVTVELLIHLRNLTGQRITDMFDLIVGTSAGGLIALSLLKDKALEEMADIYLNRGHLCFSPADEAGPEPPSEWRNSSSWNKTIRPMINLATKGAMYRVKTYEKELQRYFGATTMIGTSEDERNPRVSVVSTLTSVKPAVPFLCRNYDYPPNNTSRFDGNVTWRLWEVARATSAAPSFFDPFEKDGLQLMDGGIVANNPTAIAYHEYLRIWGRDVPVSLILSLGTGTPLPCAVGKERGLMDLVEQLIDAGVSQERVHEVMSDVLPPGTPYFRLNPTGPAFGARLDETRRSELLKLQEAARAWIGANASVMERLEAILKPKPPQQGERDPVRWQDESESADDSNYIADLQHTSDEEDSVHVFSNGSAERAGRLSAED